MAEATQTNKAFGKPPQDREKTRRGLLSTFTFAQFQFSTIIFVLAASGLVPYEDVLCVLLASIYIYAMGRFVFPPVTSKSPPSIYEGSKVLKSYVIVAAYVGLYLPLAYIMLGVAMGDKKAVQAAATHTFLLTAQVLSEQITHKSHAVSLPIRALVPILYNSGRLVSIWVWIQTDFRKGAHEVSPASLSGSSAAAPVTTATTHWVFFGRSLAIANLILWSYNLFCFLVPMYLPRVFRKYFEDEKVWHEQGGRKPN